jgi:3-hydroxybutyryl-CoA dehydrogenase
MKQVSLISVIGGGLMGHGIALTLARAGHQVRVTDPSDKARLSLKTRVTESLRLLEVDANKIEAVLNNIVVCDTIKESVTDTEIVFEAGPEKLEVKQQIFSDLENYAPKNSILASNTSVIPITKIMQNLNGKHRALGTHWWNPAHMIPLVEVIKTQWTEGKYAQAMFDLLAASGKTPVMVEKDVAGFIGNRLQHALWREAISLVENGICDAEAVDTVVKSSFGRRLAVLGPLENADLVGTDLTLDIHQNVLFDLESGGGTSPYLQNMVKRGEFGMKSGKGFHVWTDKSASKIRERVSKHLQKLEEILKSP